MACSWGRAGGQEQRPLASCDSCRDRPGMAWECRNVEEMDGKCTDMHRLPHDFDTYFVNL